MLVAFADGEARADRHVALVGLNEVEQTAKLRHGMLPVGVHAAREVVVVLVGVAVPGGDALPQAAVLAERQHLGATVASNGGGAVGRAVVDDEHVDSGQLGAKLVEHGREIVLLVQRGNEDEVRAI